MKEEWKPVKGREEFYEVSNTGKVRSLVNRYKSKGIFELKQTVNKKGYCALDLAKPHLKKCLVHRIVAEAFLDKPEGCNIVNHIDNNPSNNNVTNLEWTTYSGNLQHAQNQGRLFEAQSKGGKAQGMQATKALMDETANMIGKTYGSWTVSGLGTITKYGNANRPKLKCVCACGDTYEVDKILLQKGSSTKCRPCVAKDRSQAVISEILSTFKNTTLSKWTFTGNSNNFYGITTKKLKLEAVVNEELVLVPYTSVLKYINANNVKI